MSTSHEGYFIGLMTGTSMDAIDAVLATIKHDAKIKLIAGYSQPLTDGIRAKISRASDASADSVHDIALLDQELADAYAACVTLLLEQAGVTAKQVTAIGSHGQTIRHAPDCRPPYTVQIGDAARLVELTGVTTVSHFRQRDVAAGGQGAPLAPLFHEHLFSQPDKTVVCANLGGIANISLLRPGKPLLGFDTGPANTLMDQWVMQQRGERYDKDAKWAKTGVVNKVFLDNLLSEAWLDKPPPKSTGPELFNLRWLNVRLGGLGISPADVLRSLCEYSAVTLTRDISRHAADCGALILCGGGAHNPLLVERIKHHLPQIPVTDSASFGVAPQWVEASAFAWLAYRTLNGLYGNAPSVTGARHAAILGAIYPA